MDITDLLNFAVTSKASDLHLSSGMPPIIRVDGAMKKVDVLALEHKDVEAMLFGVMDNRSRNIYEEKLEVDFAIELPNVSRFRVNAFVQSRGASATFRVIPNNVPSLEDLKTPKILESIAEAKRGLVLVTGPTGSGKSTTLAAMLDYINSTKYNHILTIEDPIEFVHQSKKSLVNQRELNRDTHGFNIALRSALRSDPDVILIGEMRDAETIRLALTAAETGHLVFGTLHTASASKTIDRIIDVFPGNEKEMIRGMLSESLCAVISQVLIPKLGGGRIAAHEIMVSIPAIRNLIREGKAPQLNTTMQTGKTFGMQTLDQCLLSLIETNTISRNDARNQAYSKDMIK